MTQQLSAAEAAAVVNEPIGDLNADLARAARPTSRITLVLAALVVFVVVFGAGAWTHALLSGPSSSEGPSAVPGGGNRARQPGQGELVIRPEGGQGGQRPPGRG
ncbi:hypothetical protein [Amycolatopsis sp. YIM 10]|uniref:hypothetical protein n=1 Tax=Amycolatopsis sp. YIM 10 TaxID=2653857 RepID=UPI001290885C|nr:hypothetical protein [Amycolatopsis sp. YIM 10]QFU94181.1 hypothetical protein YIM_45255 [Amycolatopsis sp. YIM 10]